MLYANKCASLHSEGYGNSQLTICSIRIWIYINSLARYSYRLNSLPSKRGYRNVHSPPPVVCLPIQQTWTLNMVAVRTYLHIRSMKMPLSLFRLNMRAVTNNILYAGQHILLGLFNYMCIFTTKKERRCLSAYVNIARSSAQQRVIGRCRRMDTLCVCAELRGSYSYARRTVLFGKLVEPTPARLNAHTETR